MLTSHAQKTRTESGGRGGGGVAYLKSWHAIQVRSSSLTIRLNHTEARSAAVPRPSTAAHTHVSRGAGEQGKGGRGGWLRWWVAESLPQRRRVQLIKNKQISEMHETGAKKKEERRRQRRKEGERGKERERRRGKRKTVNEQCGTGHSP